MFTQPVQLLSIDRRAFGPRASVHLKKKLSSMLLIVERAELSSVKIEVNLFNVG